MARVLILIGGHLWTSPRSQKEAAAWSGLGHDVLVAGVWFDDPGRDRDLGIADGQRWRFAPALDLRRAGLHGRARNTAVRAGVRLAREAYIRLGATLPAVHGYGARHLLRFALRYRADFTIVHSEAGLWVGERLMHRGWRVGVDFEDWFSEDLPDAVRGDKPLRRMRELERLHACACPYVVTTSRAMADAIANTYRCRPPAVVYNTFSFGALSLRADRPADRRNPAVPSLHWFSQTIGPGRGLELLFQALARISLPYECHLRGNLTPAAATWLREQLAVGGLADRVFIHGTVHSTDLPARIAEHDVGLALEGTAIRSRDLTVTNKLFQYLQCGLAVVATETAGQREILSRTPEVGHLVQHDAASLATALAALLGDRAHLQRCRTAAAAAFRDVWSWEHQRAPLLREIQAVFPTPAAAPEPR